ncbi:FAD-binding oxidoreductase [Candidatus Margulisiibacteriota bacterium]
MDIYQKLITKLGKAKISFDKDVLEKYAQDRYKDLVSYPDVVVFPDCEDDIKIILDFANTNKVPLTPRGAGTNSTGSATPVQKGILVSFEHMNKILELDEQNKIIIVGPGIITGDIQKAVEEKGLYYPPDPSSLDECTIGGNIATNAGGARALKYGVTRNFVLGLEGYFANGTKFKFGGKQIKQAVGYNILNLLIGSEGTLGIITKIYLKLINLPKFTQDLLIMTPCFSDAISAFNTITNAKLELSSAEFMDKFCIETANKYLNKHFLDDKSFGILLQLEGNEEDILEKNLETIAEICDKLKIENIFVAESKKQKEELWETRRCLADAFKELYAQKTSFDIVVPPTEIGKYMDFIHDLDSKSRLTILGFGHLGDGNIHVNVVQKELDQRTWDQEIETLTLKILKNAVALGGTISGEHGIGLTKKPYLNLVYTEKEIALFRQIKMVFDPNDILNPGKIV